MKFHSTLSILSIFTIFTFISCKSEDQIIQPEQQKIEPKLYVANFDSNTLSVIDARENEVIKTIQVGNQPVSLNYSALNKELYVANFLSQNISVIDVLADSIINLIDLDAFPISLTISDENTLYILAQPDTLVSNVFSIFITNLITHAVDDSIDIRGGCFAFHNILVGPDMRLYFAGTLAIPTCFINPESPLIIDLKNKDVVLQHSLQTRDLAWSPDKRQLYLIGNDIIYIFDIVNLQRRFVVADGHLNSLVFSPSRKQAFITESTIRSIVVFDIPADTVFSRITLDFKPLDVAISENENVLYVSHSADNLVTVLDIDTGKVSRTIPVGENPKQMIFVTQ